MNRRSFINTLVAGCVAPHFLPGGGRIWKAVAFPALDAERSLIFIDTKFAQRMLYNTCTGVGRWECLTNDFRPVLDAGRARVPPASSSRVDHGLDE